MSAVSHFVVVVQEAAVIRDQPRALGALSGVTLNYVACHAGYRLK